MVSYIKQNKFKIILWIITTFGIGIIYPTPLSKVRFGQSFLINIFNLFLVITLFYFIEVKKITIVSTVDYIFGFIFSFIYNFTLLLTANEKPWLISGTFYLHGINLLFTVLALLAWTIVFANTLSLCTILFKKYRYYNQRGKFSIPSFQLIFLILLICWSIVIIFFLPGQISWDALKQFCEFEGKKITSLNFIYSPTNHNPWFVTLIFGSIFNFGNKLLNPNLGIFLIILVQTLISAFIYSKVVQYIWQRAGMILGIISLIIFCSPILSTYAVTIDKSTLYYAFCAGFYLSYIKLVEATSKKQLKTRDCCWYFITMTLFSQFRNDALYISLISTFILLLYLFAKHVNITKLVLTLICFVAVIGGWKLYLNKSRVIPGASSEAITIPTRQLSYVYLNDPNSLSNKDKQTINKITPLRKIRENYDLNSGDNLKNLFPVNTFLNNSSNIKEVVQGQKKIRTNSKINNELRNYLQLWIKMGLKKPALYTEVYLTANSFYLNPFSCSPNPFGSLFINYPDRNSNIVEPTWVTNYNYCFSTLIRSEVKGVIGLLLSFPLIAIFINPAIESWILILLLHQSIKNKSIALFIVLVPLIGLVCLSTLVPINGYSRYIIGEIAVVFMSFAWMLGRAK